MIKEDDEHFDSLLDDVDIAALMEEEVDSVSGSLNGMQDVEDVQDPSMHEKVGTV